ncbi:MAG: hypothetical protein ACRDHB_10030 [Actinomycetota bacterium]
MAEYKLPANLSPEEERAAIDALEGILGPRRGRPSPWALAGRTEALRMGALQVRRDAHRPWTFRAGVAFARGGTPALVGRGDAK